MQGTPRGMAFTLVELLTVVAVVAVLSALLLPTLGRVQRSARQIQCTSNLRQLILAGQMYWDDHSGHSFRWRGPSTNGGQVYWFGWLQQGTEGRRQFDPAWGALYPYLGGRGVEICPSFRYGKRTFKAKAAGASYGYGYNLALSAPAGQPSVDTSRITRLAQIAFLADAAQVNTFQPPASPENPLLEEFYYVNTTEATVHFRHQEKANTAFCDGHVAPELPVQGSRDLRVPGEIVGRLRSGVLQIE